MRDRVDELSRKGVSKADIARRLNVVPQYLNGLLNTDRGITDQFLDKFIETFSISQFDLLPNEGLAMSEQPISPSIPITSSDVGREAMYIEKIADRDRTIIELRSENKGLNREIGAMGAKLEQVKEELAARPLSWGSEEDYSGDCPDEDYPESTTYLSPAPNDPSSGSSTPHSPERIYTSKKKHVDKRN